MTGMSASAAIPSPTRPIRIPVPTVVPPRRNVPAASGTPPRPPSTPPIAPPTASCQPPNARPTPAPAAAPISIARRAPGFVRASHPAAARATPTPMPAATPIRYHSHIRASVGAVPGVSEAERRRGSYCPALVLLRPGLEAADHCETELGRSRSVDDAVVEGDGDRADPAGDDLTVADDRPLGDAANAEDPDLGVVDDRRRQQAAELPCARDGEGRAAELLGLELAVARRLREAGDLVRELVGGVLVAVADDRHDQALLGLHGDAEVVAVEVDDLVALEPRVQLGYFLQPLGHGLERQRDEPLQVDRAEVAFLHPRHGRHLRVGTSHVLGDQLPNPAQWLAASLRGVSRCQTRRRARGAHVLFGHAALRAAAVQRFEIDAELLRKPADERGRPNASWRGVSRCQACGHVSNLHGCLLLRRAFGTRLLVACRRRAAVLADHDEYCSDRGRLAFGNEDPGDLACRG